jgi:hypothetical protein
MGEQCLEETTINKQHRSNHVSMQIISATWHQTAIPVSIFWERQPCVYHQTSSKQRKRGVKGEAANIYITWCPKFNQLNPKSHNHSKVSW